VVLIAERFTTDQMVEAIINAMRVRRIPFTEAKKA
jgi:hypothetical protein